MLKHTTTPASSASHRRPAARGRDRRYLVVMWLFTDDLNHEFTSPRTRVEIEDDDLLPGAQGHLSIIEWNGHRLSLQLAPQMTMPVVFAVIPHIVLPFAVGRDQAVPYRLGVRSNAGLILNDQHRCSGVLDEIVRIPAYRWLLDNACSTVFVIL